MRLVGRLFSQQVDQPGSSTLYWNEDNGADDWHTHEEDLGGQEGIDDHLMLPAFRQCALTQAALNAWRARDAILAARPEAQMNL